MTQHQQEHNHEHQEHHHEHHHHHHHHEVGSVNAIFIFGVVLNLAFVLVEVGVGVWQDSLSLLSDAGHNLSDVLSLLLVLISFRLSARHANATYTYGYKRSTILVSLFNALLLLVAVGAIVVESIHKFRQPAPVDGVAISWTAGAGIVVNGLTALLLMRGQQHDLNVRGAFLHMVADTLVSVGVVASGVVIALTGWYVVDPIVSLVIAAVILVSTWHLLADSMRLALDGVPEDVDMDEVHHVLASADGVIGVHHVHVWPLSTTQNALTAHVVVDDITQSDRIRITIKQQLADHHISHATIEIESSEAHCPDAEDHEHNCC